MKSPSGLFLLFVLVVTLILSACGAAATQAPPIYMEPAATEPPYIEAAATEAPAAKEGESVPQDQAVGQESVAPLPTAAAIEISNQSGDLTVIERSNRMIIKNADVRLMVKDT